MKGYKAILPVALVAAMGLSCGSVITNAVSAKQEYNDYIAQARSYAEKKISVDVDEAYKNAIGINNNLEAYLEWGNYYVEQQNYDTAVSLGEIMVEEFPQESEAFIFLLQNYAQVNDYEAFFEEYNRAKTLGAVNNKLEKLYNQYRYVYKLGYGNYDFAGSFSNGLAVISTETESGTRYGYVSEDGSNATGSVYLKAGYFNSSDEAVAPVVDEKKECCFITTDGERKYVLNPKGITPVEYGMYSSERIVVFDGTNYYLCDINSNIIAGPYNYISTVNSGICVASKGDKWIIINADGEQIGKQEFDGFVLDEKNIAFRTALFANIDGKYYLINEDGKKISNEGYDDAKLFIDGLAAVKQNGKWGFINESGKMVIKSQYDGARSFSNGFAAVCIDDKWGFISISDDGKTVVDAIECQFEDATDFSRTSHNVIVKYGGKWKILSLYN